MILIKCEKQQRIKHDHVALKDNSITQ